MDEYKDYLKEIGGYVTEIEALQNKEDALRSKAVLDGEDPESWETLPKEIEAIRREIIAIYSHMLGLTRGLNELAISDRKWYVKYFNHD